MSKIEELQEEHDRLVELVAEWDKEEGELPFCRAFASASVHLRVFKERPKFEPTMEGAIWKKGWERRTDD